MSTIDDDFFDAYHGAFGPLTTVHLRTTPAEMMACPVDASGWFEWKCLPGSPACSAALAAIEASSGTVLPSSFKRWYASRHTLDMDISVARLPANPSNDPCGPLRRMLTGSDAFATLALGRGLVPFGSEAMLDAGPLCFDPGGDDDPDAWPVTFWDHELYNGDPDDEDADETGPVIFSCFDGLLRGCTAYLRAWADVVRQVADPHRWLDHRSRCIAALMAADPDGAGGEGRRYWTAGLDDQLIP